MITKENLSNCIQSYINLNGLFLVDIEISKDNDIEITIESYKDVVKIENCIDIDRLVNENFNRDVEDYSLTVSSAGLDQPFKVLNQYKKHIGQEVEIVTKKVHVKKGDSSSDSLTCNNNLSGGKIKGILNDANEQEIEISITEKVKQEGSKKKIEQINTYKYNFDQIKSCKLVIKFK